MFDDRTRKRLSKIVAFLKSQSTLVLSAVNEEGDPYATPLFYVSDDELNLYWLSSPSSNHSLYVAEHPHSSVAIFRPTEKWQEIKGLQMRGKVDKVEGEQRDSVLKIYAQRFHLGRILAAAAATSQVYGFRPEWIRYIDNSRSFGHKVEFSL